ncbi:transferase hexapeptide repeat protein [Leptospira santarosai str. CBC1531]|nr:transferase hexapeptide repeat protein [Leptospira santarosai str. CBC1531]
MQNNDPPLNLKLFTKKDEDAFFQMSQFGRFHSAIKQLYYFFKRLGGHYSYEDQIKFACMSELPMFFLNYGIMIAHAYGITLSVDEIGCDTSIGQNVTIGTNGKNLMPGENTVGHKPKIGNLVRIYAQAVISGEITIGDCVIVAASAVVTKNVPNKSIVFGNNQIKQLESHHFNYLRNILYSCVMHQYIKVPGLMYKNQKMYINSDYLLKRTLLIQNIETNRFPHLIQELF